VFDSETIRENEEQLDKEAAHVADKKKKTKGESGGESDDAVAEDAKGQLLQAT